jgi:hypothetical protein
MRADRGVLAIAIRTKLFVLLICGSALAASDDHAFTPIHKLQTWYTDRSLVDVEVVASQGPSDRAHFVEPKQSLKLRLERAYLNGIGWTEKPDYSSVDIEFDLPTMLPSALFIAPPSEVDKRGEDIKALTREEMGRRALIVRLNGQATAESLRRLSDRVQQCAGTRLDNGLYEWDSKNASCRNLHTPSASKQFVAEIEPGLFVKLPCSNALIGCSLSFPFAGFVASISFHRDHLAAWQDMIERATRFLRDKQYRGQP